MHKVVSWMFAAGPAGFAFIVSFLIGLISGVGFLSIIFRAFFSALVFAGLGFGIAFLVRVLFPELTQEQNKTNNLDTAADEGSEKSSGETVDITLEDDDDDDTVSPSLGGGELFSEGDEFVEEIKPASSSDPDVSTNDDEGDDTLDSVESIDGLPSLDAFSDSFDSTWDSQSSDEPSVSGREADVDVLGESQNPGDVARAVKTMMKRDQEG